jgi:hypothetical protein
MTQSEKDECAKILKEIERRIEILKKLNSEPKN